MSTNEASENTQLRRQLKAYVSQAQQNEQKLVVSRNRNFSSLAPMVLLNS